MNMPTIASSEVSNSINNNTGNFASNSEIKVIKAEVPKHLAEFFTKSLIIFNLAKLNRENYCHDGQIMIQVNHGKPYKSVNFTKITLLLQVILPV